MDEKILYELLKMNKLLALSITKDMDKNGKIVLLIKAGYKYKEVADLVDVTENAVKLVAFKTRKRERKNEKTKNKD